MGIRLLAGRTTRAERIKQRAAIVLEDAALSDKTKVRYYAALRKLYPYVEKARAVSDLDGCVCLWVRRMFHSGEPLLTIGDGLSALHFFQPWTKRQIPHAWKLFGVWRRLEIPSRAPPLTQRLTRAFAAYALAQNKLELATCLLLGFHCLLRTGELLSLQFSDFKLGPSTGIVSLKATKTGSRHGVHEALAITDMVTLEALHSLRALHRQQGTSALPLWSSSGSRFRQEFAQLCSVFGLCSHGFRPYSLRRGGATHLFQETKSMEAALLRGRWESSRVAKLYISDALAYLPNIIMSTYTRQMVSVHFFLDPFRG
eukprot:Skav206790  [mRNA]  locus=scaffold1990:55778:56719:- [translate_table: standard]